MSKLQLALARFHTWDAAWCLRFNHASHTSWVRRLFRGVSRLGDGVFWYALMLGLLLSHGREAIPTVLHMVIVGLICTCTYKCLKHGTSRPRPYQSSRDIQCAAAPLDQFSFPSGHTLHAVAFSGIAVAGFPELCWLLVPFTLLIGASRLVLGLHYPSDVFAGAAIGATIAGASLRLF
jgi:undecaprenyl-diphosphatase